MNFYQNFSWWLGVVEDRNDPLFLGRCRVRIAGYHNSNKIELPIEDLPWAMPMQSISSAAISGVGHSPLGPVEGTWVIGFFLDGDDCQQPVIMGTLAGIPQPDIPGTVEQSSPERIGKTLPKNAYKTPNGNVFVDTTTNEIVTSEPEETEPPKGVIGPLNQSDLDKLYDRLRQRESSNNYKAVNPIGYMGAYQFGAELLCGLGYLKSSSIKTWESTERNDFADLALQQGLISQSLYDRVPERSKTLLNFFCMSNPNLWTNKAGGSAAAFLQSKEIQDQAILDAFKHNYKDMIRRGILTNSDSKGKVAGYLYVSHLLGVGGAIKLSQGVVGADQNGTQATEYYNLGYKTVTEKSPESPATESKDRLPVAKSEKPSPIAKAKTNERHIQTSTEVGFVDPNRVYPKVDYLGEPDTNRLARHHKLKDTVVGEKDRDRITRVPVGITNETWDQPPVPYNAKYPFNHVIESESGHVIEIDDTPGNERIHLYHRSGTWVEIDRNGSFVRRVAGDDYTILERNGNILIQGRANVTIEGNSNVYVKSDCNLQVDGDLRTEVHGDYKLNVAGKIEMVAGKDIHVKSEKAIKIAASDDLSAKGKNTKIQGTGKVSVRAAGILALESGAAAGITAGGVLSMGGLAVALMSPGPPADSADSPSTSSPVDSKSPKEPKFPELIVPSRAEELTFTLDVLTENYEENGEAIQQTIQQAIDDGIITQEELEQEALVTDKDESETPEKPMVIPGCGDVYTYQDFPASYQLSPNFTLAQLSTAARCSSYKVVPQHGLSKQDIICNLKAVAEQILEPILARYPNMIVTSGFRSPGDTNSQHQRGQAVDMQFLGVSNSDYFEIAKWIKQNINYDQMLLEYQSIGTGKPWIHVSFNRDNCRNICHTFFNHKMAPGGRGTLLNLS